MTENLHFPSTLREQSEQMPTDSKAGRPLAFVSSGANECEQMPRRRGWLDRVTERPVWEGSPSPDRAGTGTRAPSRTSQHLASDGLALRASDSVPVQPVEVPSSPNSSATVAPEPQPLVNPGVLMTVGHYHGYPRLPFKPGVAIAEGTSAWRTFTRTADADMLALAAEAARSTWRDDPMTNDLYYVTTDDGDDPPAGCCTESRPCPDHLDDVFEAYRNGQENDYLEHGRGGEAA
jgi:hypothetical protein